MDTFISPLSFEQKMTISGNNTSDDSVQSKSTKIKAVIFDLDGTLLDTESLSCRAVIEAFDISQYHPHVGSIPSAIREALQSQGNLLPWELKKRILGRRGTEWVPIVLGYAQEKWKVELFHDWKDGWESRCNINNGEESKEREEIIEEFMNAWEIRCGDLCAEVAACPGATELVKALQSARIPLGIATSSRAASVEKKRLNHEEMFASIQVIVTGDDDNVKDGKPAPDIYLEASKRLGVYPSECLVFEDALLGAQSGKSAGCRVIAVPDPRIEKDNFASVADEVLTDMWEFSGEKWGISLEMSELKN